MRRILRENGLSILLGLFFLSSIFGQIFFGHQESNEDRQQHGLPPLGFVAYLGSSHFVEVTMENWESEFLQMGVYVFLTAFLYQKGSAESKSLSEPEPVDRDPRRFKNKMHAPWPVRRGGFVLKLYENSLSLAFLLLFLIAFLLHAAGGRGQYNQEQLVHGQPAVTFLGYLATSRFWFESFQNWQSEFLAIGCMVVFSIFLRQRGSPESKPVDSPHFQTGTE
ncbi:MAG: DUF6766 family protein [Chthoniobacterales bacterium]